MNIQEEYLRIIYDITLIQRVATYSASDENRLTRRENRWTAENKVLINVFTTCKKIKGMKSKRVSDETMLTTLKTRLTAENYQLIHILSMAGKVPRSVIAKSVFRWLNVIEEIFDLLPERTIRGREHLPLKVWMDVTENLSNEKYAWSVKDGAISNTV